MRRQTFSSHNVCLLKGQTNLHLHGEEISISFKFGSGIYPRSCIVSATRIGSGLPPVTSSWYVDPAMTSTEIQVMISDLFRGVHPDVKDGSLVQRYCAALFQTPDQHMSSQELLNFLRDSRL